MEKIIIKNRHIYRDIITKHIYRLSKDIKGKTKYFSCLIKRCSGKVQISNDVAVECTPHSHSIEISINEYNIKMFDKSLNEFLHIDRYDGLKPEKLYDAVLEHYAHAKFPMDHKRKKIQTIRTHRCISAKSSSHISREQKILECPPGKKYIVNCFILLRVIEFFLNT